MTVPCIDLRTYKRYRAWHEFENRRARLVDDPWDLIIQGGRGFVAPWGGEMLVACTNHTITTRHLRTLIPEATVVQDGADGQNVIFHAKHLESVADLLRLRKRRQMTPEQKAIAAARLGKSLGRLPIKQQSFERQTAPDPNQGPFTQPKE